MADATITQRCSLCNTVKTLDLFYVRENGMRRKDCIECYAIRRKKYWGANKEKEVAQQKRWSAANKDRTLNLNRKWREVNRDKDRESKSAWRKRNPHMIVAATQRRNASKLLATPAWRSESAISEIYQFALQKTIETGIKWQVDHIVPLRSNLVCGLHVEHNLQVITAIENKKKGNLWWPDMP